MKTLKIFVILLTLSACSKNIKYDLPYDEPKITIDARIVGGDSIYVLTSLSSFILDDKNPVTDQNFDVYLYEDGQLVEKLNSYYGGTFYGGGWDWTNEQDYYIYRSNYKPKPGHTYKIESIRSGYETAYGEQYLMEPIQVLNKSIDTTTNTINVQFKDAADSQDYYRIRILSKIGSDIHPQWFKSSDALLEFFYEYSDDFEEPDSEKYGNIAFMTDEFFNGKIKTLELKLDYVIDFSMELEISRISEDLYLHERSKAAQWRSDGFFSEPTQIYSNVVNGHGIVGAVAPVRIVL